MTKLDATDLQASRTEAAVVGKDIRRSPAHPPAQNRIATTTMSSWHVWLSPAKSWSSKDRNVLPSQRHINLLFPISYPSLAAKRSHSFITEPQLNYRQEESTTLYQYICFGTISTMVKQAEWKSNSPQHHSLKLCLLLSLQSFHFRFLVTCCSKIAMQHNL